MKKLKNIHPGEILLEEFLLPMNISQYRLSKDLKIPQTRVSEIVKGKRRVTSDTALRLSKYFGNSAKFWMGLQNDYDIEGSETKLSKELKRVYLEQAKMQHNSQYEVRPPFGQLAHTES